jgi:hypothetical protein
MPKRPPGWRLKVVLTNGTQTRDLLSLLHTGHTIIAGVAGHKAHSTYHESGERHTKVEGSAAGEYHAVRSVQRPAELHGVEQMHVLSFNNEAGWFGELSPFPRSRVRSRANAIITLDSRTIPVNAPYHVRLGVTDGRAALDAESARILADGEWTIDRQELFEERNPTVWLLALRAAVGRPANVAAMGFASAIDYNHITEGSSITFLSMRGIFGRGGLR